MQCAIYSGKFIVARIAPCAFAHPFQAMQADDAYLYRSTAECSDLTAVFALLARSVVIWTQLEDLAAHLCEQGEVLDDVTLQHSNQQRQMAVARKISTVASSVERYPSEKRVHFACVFVLEAMAE